ncbi:class I SAM-dependent methyltransferase [Roseobacter weihaiensis]|uniref:class I SAM-dependent methyltransferase n=1 Tax=Roseobacter weihaiensis TaxID=2763262 RepID=UPI001D0BA751|nr:methyltransferase domain-containing protein [Roseobacter sp. H9]
MSVAPSDQAAFWTGEAGEVWVRQQRFLDALMAPVLEGVLARADLQPGQTVLDIGCGTGDSTIRARRSLGETGLAVGADISSTMLALARDRARGIKGLRFIDADAASYGFDGEEFDRLISRFGVMFFPDPKSAFLNIIKFLKPDAHVSFACWGTIENNPWFTVPARAAKMHLGAPPKVDPDDPGPFAFRDPARVSNILQAAGFYAIDVCPTEISLTPPGTVAEIAETATCLGPASRTLEHFGGDRADADRITDLVAEAFEVFTTADGLQVPAEINFVTARVPAAQ